MQPLENEFSIDVENIPGYVEEQTITKIPATELLDPEFHVKVADTKAIGSFESWTADCYDAVLSYFKATSKEEKRRASIRIGVTAWEAMESTLSVGRILNAIADNWLLGIKGDRKAFDWHTMHWDDGTETLYIAKTVRHLVQADMALTLEDKIKHLAALFCNANILWRRCGDLYL